MVQAFSFVLLLMSIGEGFLAANFSKCVNDALSSDKRLGTETKTLLYNKIVTGNIVLGVTSILYQSALRDCVNLRDALYGVSIAFTVVDIILSFRKISQVMNISEDLDSTAELAML